MGRRETRQRRDEIERDKAQSKLKTLAQCLLDRSIQCTDTNDPVEDALDPFFKYRDLTSQGFKSKGIFPRVIPEVV